MKDLKAKTIRGGFARMCAQGASLLLRVGSLMVLARLLGPKDFGLVGMVTAFTGVFKLFRDFGLSSATVQRTTVTDEQISTLFWINMLVGAVLGLLVASHGASYRQLLPRAPAVWSDGCFGGWIPFQRRRRAALRTPSAPNAIYRLGGDNVISLMVGTAIGIGGAKAGYGYWALVAMTVALPLISTIGLWLTAAWIPGMPHRRVGIRSMMRFGGTLTLNGLVVYVAQQF